MNPYYEEPGITIYCGDCRDILPQLVPVDLVLTDPPYGVGLKGKRAHAGHGQKFVRVRHGTYGFDDTPDYVREVVIPVIESARVRARRVALTPGTRNMWLYPPADDVGCFYSASGTGMGKWGFTCMQPILYYGSDPYLESASGSRPNSCGQVCPNDANEVDHPCAKPISMMLWLVNRCAGPHDLILDPFMGSGTTLVAAKRLGRRAIGIEIEERYCEIAARRIQEASMPLFDAIEPEQASLLLDEPATEGIPA